MSQKLIKELGKENLCTHFILPLLKLNKQHFVSSNFVNCYLTRNGSHILVQVVEPMLISQRVLKHTACIGNYVDSKDDNFIIYQMSRAWKNDVRMFMDGKFSEMSKAAKEVIRRYSGLTLERKEGIRSFTDGRLLALEKHPLLKAMWEKFLSSSGKGMINLPAEAELMSIPGEESYLEFDQLKRATR